MENPDISTLDSFYRLPVITARAFHFYMLMSGEKKFSVSLKLASKKLYAYFGFIFIWTGVKWRRPEPTGLFGNHV